MFYTCAVLYYIMIRFYLQLFFSFSYIFSSRGGTYQGNRPPHKNRRNTMYHPHLDTDLIEEARALWQPQPGDPGTLSGVRSEERLCHDVPVTEVEILDAEGARQLGKPVGRYLTLELGALLRDRAPLFEQGVAALADSVGLLLPEGEGPVLVVGLGNRAVTPDAIGPRTADQLLVTRHLVEQLPEVFGTYRPVAALAAGVLGTTGVESGELVEAVVARLRPAAVLAVDALCAQSAERLGTTVQLSNTGIVPGSGVGNARHALTQETLGVPVIAIGVPTVVRAGALARQWGCQEEAADALSSLLVTPKAIDVLCADVSRLLSRGISLALQPGLTLEELETLLA
jgi:spore protease